MITGHEQAGDRTRDAEPRIMVRRSVLARRDLTLTAKIVLHLIADRVGRNGRSWPSRRRLAEELGGGQTAVVAAVTQLDGLRAALAEIRSHGARYATERPAGENTA